MSSTKKADKKRVGMTAKKCLIVVPITGRTDEEISADVERARADIAALGLEPVEMLDKWKRYKPSPKTHRDKRNWDALKHVSRTMTLAADCGAVYLCNNNDWFSKSRSCGLLLTAAYRFGLRRIYAAAAAPKTPEAQTDGACA